MSRVSYRAAAKVLSFGTRLLVVILFVIANKPISAAELTGYLGLSSDNVYRGVTRSDGHRAAQVGADVYFDNGLFAGVWASTLDIGNGIVAKRDTQVNYYLGYNHELADNWTLGGTVVVHRFPGAFGPLDYDHEEFSVSLNYQDQLWLEYSQIPDYYNTGARVHNYEIFAEWPFVSQSSLSAGAGWFDVSAFTGKAYAYWQLGVSAPLWKNVAIDLRYHDADRSVPIVSSPDRTDARLVLSARLHFR